MPVYKEKNKWYAKYYYTNDLGEHKSKSSKRFDSKKEAIEAERKIIAALNTLSSSNITFEQVYEEFLEWKKGTVKTTTCITYPSMWAHCEAFKKLKVKDLNVARYNEFKKTLNAKNLSNPRKDKIHKFVRQLVDFANKHYDVKNDVFDKVTGFKDPNAIRTKNVDFYTYDEFKKFINNVEDIRYHALFIVLYYMGLRIGEANALTWEDIDFENHLVYINKQVNTKIKGVPYLITSTKKSASDRILPLEEETENELKALKKYWDWYRNFNDDWFLFGGARPLGESKIHTVKNNASDAAGLKRIRIHDFRHSCASFLIHIGCEPMIIQNYLGHASLKITMDTYSHMYPNKLQKAATKIKEFKSSFNG